MGMNVVIIGTQFINLDAIATAIYDLEDGDSKLSVWFTGDPEEFVINDEPATKLWEILKQITD